MLDEVFLCSVVSLGMKRFSLRPWYYCVPADCNIKWISLPWTRVRESEPAVRLPFSVSLEQSPGLHTAQEPAGPDNRLLSSAENTC